jgi:hypothetical protein
MRPVQIGDLIWVARAVALQASDRQEDFCRSLFDMAQAADLYRRATGCCHPNWGNGSLMAAAGQSVLPPEPGFDDPSYVVAWRVTLRIYEAWLISQTRN